MCLVQNRKYVLRRFAGEQGLRIWARGKRAFFLGNSGGFETFSPRSFEPRSPDWYVGLEG